MIIGFVAAERAEADRSNQVSASSLAAALVLWLNYSN